MKRYDAADLGRAVFRLRIHLLTELSLVDHWLPLDSRVAARHLIDAHETSRRDVRRLRRMLAAPVPTPKGTRRAA